MIDEKIEVAYLFEDRPTVESLTALFEEMVTHPYNSSTDEEFEIVYFDESGRTHTKTGDVKEAATICSRRMEVIVYIEFGEFQLEVGPDYGNQIISDIHNIVFTQYIYPFTDQRDEKPDPDVEQRRRRFCEVLADAADTLKPIWGFGRRGGLAIEPGLSATDIMTSISPPLYEFNYWNKRVVKRIGQESIASSSAWFVDEFECGDIFLVARKPPKRCSPVSGPCIELAEELGLSVAEFNN